MTVKLPGIRTFALTIACIVWSVCASAGEEKSLYASAEAAFAGGDFAQAAQTLEQLAQTQPQCADCAHLLGRAYGRMAEQASWARAIKLAKKTRVALENAVDLDPSNANALEDLIRYYRAAPGFLGGDSAKAKRLELRLQRLRADQTS